MRMWYLPSFFTRGEMWLCPLNSDKRRLYSSATLEGAFWSGTGFFQLFVTYSYSKCGFGGSSTKSHQRCPPRSGHQWFPAVVDDGAEVILHSHGTCWSSFQIYRDDPKWEHLLIHDSVISGLYFTLVGHTAMGLCALVCGMYCSPVSQNFLWGKVGWGLRWEKKKNFKNPTIRSSTIPPVQSATGCSFSTVVRGISKTVLVYHRTFINIMHKSHQI